MKDEDWRMRENKRGEKGEGRRRVAGDKGNKDGRKREKGDKRTRVQ
jgi:hypothetical protein